MKGISPKMGKTMIYMSNSIIRESYYLKHACLTVGLEKLFVTTRKIRA